eukprot:CAMPEP_0114158820 /NCGR_PEP_ID=MMETSP0043_2-20121206/27436_1 /TAXON_ID=464988 /ORGANISM="Hemiselmis andersenii, Strain CCMP644" /LENGTH=32 /DNA_ID= /DNA_START= /DNA_END= /DNA_ORIENTATION=
MPITAVIPPLADWLFVEETHMKSSVPHSTCTR